MAGDKRGELYTEPNYLNEKIEIGKIVLRKIRMPIISAFETSGWREEEKNCIIVEFHSSSFVGYGECPVRKGPWYSYETIATAWHVMNDFMLPFMLRKEAVTYSEIMNNLARIRGHNMAKSSFETALLDLEAKERNLPLSEMLGGTQEMITIGASIGVQKTIEELIKVVTRFVDDGYRRIKVKIKPGHDEKPIAAVRKEFPDILLMVDANGSYDLSDLDVLKRLDSFDLLMIEQPFAWDDLVDHAKLRRTIKTPICLDESISSLNDLKSAVALNSCDSLNIKPARVGGLIVSKTLSEICRTNKMTVWCGGLMETGIGRASNLALASLPAFVMPSDIAPSNRNFKEDIVEPAISLNHDGTIVVPKGPGIGVTVLESRLEKYTIEKKIFKSQS